MAWFRAGRIHPRTCFCDIGSNVSSSTVTTVRYHKNTFEDVSGRLETKPHTILYVNVLEHIEDDLTELQLVHETLVLGGKALIFVPAMPSLYGNFDRKIGHFR